MSARWHRSKGESTDDDNARSRRHLARGPTANDSRVASFAEGVSSDLAFAISPQGSTQTNLVAGAPRFDSHNSTSYRPAPTPSYGYRAPGHEKTPASFANPRLPKASTNLDDDDDPTGPSSLTSHLQRPNTVQTLENKFTRLAIASADDKSPQRESGRDTSLAPPGRPEPDSGQAQPSSSSLSPLAKMFAKIPVGRFEECAQFIQESPAILHENTGGFLREAVQARTDGNHSYARSCCQQALIVRHCANLSKDQIDSFFAGQMNKADEQRKFFEDFDRIHSHVQKSAMHRAPKQKAEHYAIPQRDNKDDTKVTEEWQQDSTPGYDTNSTRQPSHVMSTRTMHRTGAGVEHDNSGDPTYATLTPHVSCNKPDVVQGPNYQEPGSRAVPWVGNDTGVLTKTASGGVPYPLDTQNSENPLMPSRASSIVGSQISQSGLDPQFFRRHSRFFTVGRVFALLWHENAAAPQAGVMSPSGNHDARQTLSRFGEPILSHIRNMIVVKEGHGFCLAVPINTYAGKGLSKRGFHRVDIDAHAVVYMSDAQPVTFPGEPQSRKRPIAVDKTSSDGKLHQASRINFSQMHTVQHNVKVRDVGQITTTSMPLLLSYWTTEVQSGREVDYN